MNNCICGTCGTNKSNNENAYCINDHDNWIEAEDFGNPELDVYIENACNNLSIDRETLREAVIAGTSLMML